MIDTLGQRLRYVMKKVAYFLGLTIIAILFLALSLYLLHFSWVETLFLWIIGGFFVLTIIALMLMVIIKTILFFHWLIYGPQTKEENKNENR